MIKYMFLVEISNTTVSPVIFISAENNWRVKYKLRENTQMKSNEINNNYRRRNHLKFKFIIL